MVAEDGWASGSKGGGGGRGGGNAVSWKSGHHERDVDVESSLMGGLAEMQERDGPRKGRGGVIGLLKRRRIFIASFLGVVLLIAGSIVGESGSSARNAAAKVCMSLSAQEMSVNRASEWLGWAEAVKGVYLHHKAPTAELASGQENDALRCAKGGWQTACTERLFGSKDEEPQQSDLERLSRDRRMLEAEYKAAVADVPQPEARQLRLPAGEALRFKRGVCEAELAVCRMPPEDATCLQARGEEIQVVDALAAQLRKVISEATGKGGRFSGDVAPGSADVILLDKIGRLIREQDVRDQIRHSTWRTMNAVSAVILHQILERSVAAKSPRREDVMLYEGSREVLYIGTFSGLRYNGKGTLYYRGGAVAYMGDWVGGRMHGDGILKDRDGNVLWKGKFSEGRPVSGLFW